MALTFDRSEPGFWLSAGVHVALLTLALVGISAEALPEAQEGVPVEVITENQFSEITKGERNAEKPLSDAKPRADRKAETFEEREPDNAKVDAPAAPTRTADMKVASVDEVPLRINEPDPQEVAKAAKAAQEKAEKAAQEKAEKAAQEKAAAKAAAEAKAEAKAAQEKAEAERREQLDKLIERQEAEAAAADAKAKADAEAKAKKQAELADKFNAGDIRQMLASKVPSQSTGATGHEVQRTASLGAATGTAQRLSPSLRDALVGMLQQQIERCYSAPPGAAQGVVLPMLDIRLNPNGSLAAEPRIMRGGASAVDQSIAQAALRAVRRCAPYKIPAQYAPYYNDWKAINAEFEFSAA